MNYKRSRHFFWGGLLAEIAAGFFSHCAGLLLILIAVGQAAAFYRCPHCGFCLLDIQMLAPSRCPNCGSDL